jgi:probable rRNA maturation factor
MNKYEVINDYDKPIDNIDIIKELLEFTLKYLNLDNTVFNVIFVDNEEIREINRSYRDIDKETDVISFALEEANTIDLGFRLLGDIYISYDKVLEQAKAYKHSIDREICFLTIHGFLHLLGYNHTDKKSEDIMFTKQEKILSEFLEERENNE